MVVVDAVRGVIATGLGAGKQGGEATDEGTGVEVEGAEAEEAEGVVGDSDDAESEDDDDDDDEGDEVDDDDVDDDDVDDDDVEDPEEEDDDDELEVEGEFKSPGILSGDVGLPLSAKATGTGGVSSSDVACGG